MDNQRNELQKLYKSGVLTKEEMETELKKIPVRKNPTNTKPKFFGLVLIAVYVAIVIIAVASFYDDDTTPVPATIESHNLSTSIETIEGSVLDRMTTDGKHLFLFDLGEFSDIDSYHPDAKKHLRGKIHFWVCPTKDGKKIAFIQIKKFPSLYAGGDDNYTRTLNEKEKIGLRWVGPIIYDLGRQWYNPWEGGKDTSDWQPTAKIERVFLTPKAIEEKNKLLKYIAMGRISESDGNLYAAGRQLTKQEISDMVKFGILIKKHWYSKPEIVEDYNKAIDIAQTFKVVKE